MRIYSSASTDGGATWTPNTEVYASPGGAVCTCCHPSLVVDLSGNMAIMFRNDLDGQRDMYLKVGRQPARKLGTGHWTLSACPMDGGGVARSAEGRLLTVWRREQTVFEAAPGATERPLGEGKDAVVAFAGEEPIVAWTAPSGIVLRRGDEGSPSLADVAGGFAALVGLADRSAVLAWQRGEASVVRRLRAAAQSSASANSASRSNARVNIPN